MILVDSSIWIELFRRESSLRPETAFDIEEAVTCLPVIQEVLQGFRDQTAFRRAREALLSLSVVESPLALDVYESAVELYRAARRQGLTVRSSTDCLIAACALKHDLTVLHRDRDYAALARVCDLRERSL
ncbi:MAG: PIN domain-containing protein [Elusimicrobia bacterium]|nr:PIN domain-containing protein [Elusimicrobiota bacterium]